jgi:hypothetical protein
MSRKEGRISKEGRKVGRRVGRKGREGRKDLVDTCGIGQRPVVHSLEGRKEGRGVY